jgi:hypothetical protein
MLTNKYVRAAGVTLDDCMLLRTVTVAVALPAEIQRTPVAIEAVIPAPAAIVSLHRTLGACSFEGSRVDNVCKARLDSAILFLKANEGSVEIQGNELTGSVRAGNIRSYFTQNGIDESRVVFALGDEDTSELTIIYMGN